MRNRSNLQDKDPAVATACRHYWVIEAADGPVSMGVCRFCGEEREFQNSWTSLSYTSKDARVFELPNMLDDEEADKEDS